MLRLLRQVGSLVVATGTVKDSPVVRVKFVNAFYERWWQRRKRREDLTPAEAATLGAILIGYAATTDPQTLSWCISAMENILNDARKRQKAFARMGNN